MAITNTDRALLAGTVALGLAFGCSRVHAATISLAQRGTPPAPVVTLDGSIEAGDTIAMQHAIAQLPQERPRIVFMQSIGGDGREGIRLGLALREAHAITAVPSYCYSACATAWLGGEHRMMATTGRIGFHGAYTEINGVPQVSSVGNAELRRYVAQLGLGADVADFITAAGPDSINMLTPADAGRLHLDVDVLDLTPKPVVG